MGIPDATLSQILVDTELLSKEKLALAHENAVNDKISLAESVVRLDLLSDEQVGKLIADSLKFSYIRLSSVSIPDDILAIIPEIVARKQQIIAFKKDKQGLHVGMADPEATQIREFLRKKVGLPVIAHFATARDIDDALRLYSKDVQKTFETIISQNVEEAKHSTNVEPPIITIVDTLIQYASRNKASDIHIEPEEEACLVRFRIDGILHDIVTLPLELHPQIITRIKVMAKLRTDEHQAAQDGKIVQKTKDENLDIRTSIVPITRGEKVVMRLLSERSRQFSLTDLGFSDTDLEKVKSAYKKPHGMILATGPTGSGKTTTMYAILKLLNKRGVNIMTIEDPVEYDMESVNQIQVNTKTNLTFAAGLRSIVRQDPDVILVGEIRDEETAGIAINSAMTGHLVLSTLHTNDAATTLPRLLDMSVEPFLIASTVNVIIGQRLVRKICSQCRVSLEIDRGGGGEAGLSQELMQKHFGAKGKIRVYEGKGCPVCHNTGYVGRVGIYEVLIINDNVRTAIVDRKDASEIKSIAMKNDMTTMLEDGLEKVKNGVTTIAEILRVTTE